MDRSDEIAACGPLGAKAAELIAAGPGRLRSKRDAAIDFVQMQRDAEATLTDNERSEIDQRLVALTKALTGVERPRRPPIKGEAEFMAYKNLPLLRRLVTRRPRMSPGSRDVRVRREWDDMTAAAGGPALLPPPNDVIEVARSFLIAERAHVDDQTVRSRLRSPWLAVTIERDELEPGTPIF